MNCPQCDGTRWIVRDDIDLRVIFPGKRDRTPCHACEDGTAVCHVCGQPGTRVDDEGRTPCDAHYFAQLEAAA